MLPDIRKIRIIGSAANRVTYEHLHSGKLCSVPSLTFNLMLSAGAFEVVNGAEQFV